MSYHIVWFTPEALMKIESFGSYSEAEMKYVTMKHDYPYYWAEIVSDADLLEAETA